MYIIPKRLAISYEWLYPSEIDLHMYCVRRSGQRQWFKSYYYEKNDSTLSALLL